MQSGNVLPMKPLIVLINCSMNTLQWILIRLMMLLATLTKDCANS